MEDPDKNKGDALSEPTTDAPETPPTATDATGADAAGAKPVKEPNAFKKFFKKFNLYLLLFILVVVIGAAVSLVSYLNSKKAPKEPSIATQELTTDSLKQLANSDTTVGSAGQTLTVQGNSIFSGQVLMRSDLNVAGTIKVGTDMLVPSITVSGKSNLNDTQINSLQVANTAVFQSNVTLQRDLNVAGSAAFSGAVTIGQLTVNRLVISGNGQVQVPNHISFPGASPGRTIDGSVLGAGGSASIGGSDTAGTININTGSGTNAGCFATIRFNQPYTGTPHVIVSPVGAAAGQTQYYVNRNSTTFSICTVNAPPAGQSFAFDYFVTQ